MKRFYIVLNTQCMNECINCCVPLDIVKERNIISLEKLREIMERYPVDAKDVVELTGGEPILDRKLFVDSLRYLVSERGFNRELVNVLSHGHHFADRELARLAGNFCGHVSSTFYGLSASDHDSTAGVSGVFEQKNLGLRNLRSAGVQLHIKFLFMKRNAHRAVDFVEFCAERFPGAILVFALLDYSGTAWANREKLKVSLAEIRPHLAAAIDRAKDLGIESNVLFPMCMIDPCRWDLVLSRDWTTTELEKVIFIEPEGDKILVVEQIWPDVRFQEKPDECGGCALFNRCVWEWGGYTHLYQLEGEIQPCSMA